MNTIRVKKRTHLANGFGAWLNDHCLLARSKRGHDDHAFRSAVERVDRDLRENESMVSSADAKINYAPQKEQMRQAEITPPQEGA